MNKTTLRSYAPQARKDWHAAFTARANLLCKGHAFAPVKKGGQAARRTSYSHSIESGLHRHAHQRCPVSQSTCYSMHFAVGLPVVSNGICELAMSLCGARARHFFDITRYSPYLLWIGLALLSASLTLDARMLARSTTN